MTFLNNTSCNNSSSKEEFGLCDDSDILKKPAYLVETINDNCVAVISNNENKVINFVAIDHCIDINRDNGEDASKCDGLLYFDDTIIFIELKDRKDKKARKWKNKGYHQLKETIILFEQQTESKRFNIKKAYICNKKYPKADNTSNKNKMEKFKNEIGYILRIQQRIKI